MEKCQENNYGNFFFLREKDITKGKVVKRNKGTRQRNGSKVNAKE